jgi:hypothetical protein
MPIKLGKLTTNPTTETPWTLWRIQNGVRSLAGEFTCKDDALRAIAQLKKLFPNSDYYLEFTGKAR